MPAPTDDQIDEMARQTAWDVLTGKRGVLVSAFTFNDDRHLKYGFKVQLDTAEPPK
jgi:hypothetical protein